MDVKAKKLRAISVALLAIVSAFLLIFDFPRFINSFLENLFFLFLLSAIGAHLFLTNQKARNAIEVLVDGINQILSVFGLSLPKEDYQEISEIRVVKVGALARHSTGDFVENIEPSLIFFFCFDSSQENCSVFNSEFGWVCYKDCGLHEVVDLISLKSDESVLKRDVIGALIKSALDHDSDGIASLGKSFEDGIYEASETEDVESYRSGAFAIGSSITQVGAMLYEQQGQIVYQGERLSSAADLYGMLDEDDCWVLGFKT